MRCPQKRKNQTLFSANKKAEAEFYTMPESAEYRNQSLSIVFPHPNAGQRIQNGFGKTSSNFTNNILASI